MYGGVDVEIHIFFTLTLVLGGWSASCLRHFSLKGKSAQYLSHRRMGGPQSQYGQQADEKFLTLTNLKPRHLIHSAHSQQLHQLH
jgi:hypothetical protein